MTLADYLINYLADRGIHKMFVVTGAANAHLIDAFERVPGADYVSTMHEQGAGFAAEGYAKVRGVPGVAIATSGPGGMNLVTPIGNCFYDSVPAIFITGQINSNFLREDPSLRQVGFQETDIVSIVSPITKYAAQIKHASEIRYELERCFFLATEARPGPVLLDIPINLQQAEVHPEVMVGFDVDAERTVYSVDTIDRKADQLLADLKQASRPVILVGQGVGIAGAKNVLQAVGRLLKIPIFPTWNALDIVPSDYDFYAGRVGTYGGKGRNFGLQNSDLLLAVGTRISGRITGGNLKTFARSAKKYVVDVDRALLQAKLQQVPFDVSIHADAKCFLNRLLAKLPGVKLPDVSGWTEKVMEWRDRYDPVRPEYFEQENPVNPYAFLRVLSQEMTATDIFIADCGGNIVMSNHAFETKNGQRYLTNNGNSPMGFSFCGAIGAWFASDRTGNVVCIIGDGGFNMNIQELQTLLTYNVKVKTFIINNHNYGIIKAFQDTNVGGRHAAAGPEGYVPPDFLKISSAYGIATRRISKTQDAREMIREVLDYDDSVVCDVDTGSWYAYAPRVFGWATPIEDMHPYLPRDEFRRNMIIEPVEGWENPVEPGDKKTASNKGGNP